MHRLLTFDLSCSFSPADFPLLYSVIDLADDPCSFSVDLSASAEEAEFAIGVVLSAVGSCPACLVDCSGSGEEPRLWTIAGLSPYGACFASHTAPVAERPAWVDDWSEAFYGPGLEAAASLFSAGWSCIVVPSGSVSDCPA